MQFAIENTFDLKNLFVAHSCILKKKKIKAAKRQDPFTVLLQQMPHDILMQKLSGML